MKDIRTEWVATTQTSMWQVKGQLALRYQPNLKIWASPWSPPTWMKYNKHYAAKMSEPRMPPNGLKPDQEGKEGSDLFIQEDRYFSAYATYIARFVQEYRSQGINIDMVMPQNEFNSAQPFPSCCWTPEGLARFISFLGPEMQRLGVDVFFGTMERPNAARLVGRNATSAMKMIKLVDKGLLPPESISRAG